MKAIKPKITKKGYRRCPDCGEFSKILTYGGLFAVGMISGCRLTAVLCNPYEAKYKIWHTQKPIPHTNGVIEFTCKHRAKVDRIPPKYLAYLQMSKYKFLEICTVCS